MTNSVSCVLVSIDGVDLYTDTGSVNMYIFNCQPDLLHSNDQN